MAHQTPIGNPFMLMLHPEVVLAAVESSERLSQLNRHMCRPLDRPAFATAKDDVNEVVEAAEAAEFAEAAEADADADADSVSQGGGDDVSERQ